VVEVTQKDPRLISLQVCGVLFLGLVLRLIAWANTTVINPDGALFIHQGRAIYYGQTDTLFCALNYLPNLPILIAGSYRLFHDWVFAGRFVSFLFGFGTLVPIYLLLKRFFNERIVALGTLVFAVLPVFVGSSVDIIRDPVCWFFTALGLYWFTIGLDDKRLSFFTLSSLSLMLAAWARIEASLIIICSLLFLSLLAIRKRDQAFSQLACFFLPVVTMALVGLVAALATKGYAFVGMVLENASTGILSSPFPLYRTLSEKLANLALQNRYDNLGLFLAEARKNMWLVAFGSVLNRCLEAFFYLFFIIFGIGFITTIKSFHAYRHVQYFVSIFIMFLFMLYIHTLRSWYIDYRHVCLLIISCTVFMGFGMDRIIQSILSKLPVKENAVTIIMALLIVALPLPKNLMTRDADKRVFKEIGRFLAHREGTSNFISIATSCSNYRLISFYANLDYPGAPCPVESESTCWEYFADSFDHFMEHVKTRYIKYFVWSERLWPGGTGSVFEAPYSLHLKELKRWHHPDTGEMILYEVVDQ
jgi:hypothetical protein